MFAISRFSLISTLRSPTAIVFSLLFPVIFILVFGSIDPSKPPVLKIATVEGCDTTGPVYEAINSISGISLLKQLSATQATDDLKKGRVAALLNIIPDGSVSGIPHYRVRLKTGSATAYNLRLLHMLIDEAVKTVDGKAYPGTPSIASVTVYRMPGRAHRNIDFILPGQLGFSLLMAGVFGSSFLLFSLRKNLVLKRMKATPVTRLSVITGEMISRLFFHIISFTVMVLLGCLLFKFTLVNGIETFAEMLIYSLFGLGIFMGIGFIISGAVQNENAITPIANTLVLPQILLCGLFFPIQNYPHWLEQFCSILPLTIFVDGLRKIAFEGTHFWQLPLKIGGLLLWTLVIFPASIKSFKWE